MSTVLYACSILVMLSMIIVVHEAGHFFTAKSLGIKPKTFAIGFGPKLWQHQGKDGVNYRLNLLFLGGYVDFDMDQFNQEATWKRFMVMVGGVAANFFLAIFVSFIFVCITKIPMIFTEALPPNEPFTWGMLLPYTWQSTMNGLNIVWASFVDLSRNPNLNSMMGPIQLMKEGSSLLKEQALLALPLLLMLDINIMILNALPLPALDGGRAVLTVLEMITRRKFPYEEKLHFAGFILLLGFTLFVFGNDIYKLFI